MQQGPGGAVRAALAGRREAAPARPSPWTPEQPSARRTALPKRRCWRHRPRGDRHSEASRDLWVDLLRSQDRVPGPANSPATPLKCVLTVQGTTGPATPGDGAGWRPRNRVAGPALLAQLAHEQLGSRQRPRGGDLAWHVPSLAPHAVEGTKSPGDIWWGWPGPQSLAPGPPERTTLAPYPPLASEWHRDHSLFREFSPLCLAPGAPHRLLSIRGS